MIIALIGNPDCGKSTFFNRVCKNKRKVGSFPGISVDVGLGKFKLEGKAHTLADLPGTYSLSAHSADECVAVDFITNGHCDKIINIVDASTIERGITLTTEVIKSFPSVPLVLGLSRFDRCKKKGISIDCEELSKRLGIPVIPFSAGRTGDKGYKLLIRAAAKTTNLPKCTEKDPQKLLSGIIKQTQIKSSFSRRADRIILNKFFAVPIFFVIMALIFYLTFFVLSPPFEKLIGDGCEGLSRLLRKALQSASVDTRLCDFLVDGVLSGFFGVIGFLPVIVILFFFLTLITDCGYLARIAFIFDSPMRKVGLSGRCAVPALFALGCTVPALMSTRIIPSESERQRALFAVPFISCPAKIPMYLIIIRAFFKDQVFLTLTLVYMLGFFVMLFCTFLKSRQKSAQSDNEFILELPDYSVPSFSSIIGEALGKARDFLEKSVTIVPFVSAVLYILGHLSPEFSFTDNIESSTMFLIGKLLSFPMRPMGLGEPLICTALLAGIGAKEAVAGVLGTLLGTASSPSTYSVSIALSGIISPRSAVSLLIFFALSPPCVAAFSAMRKESGSLSKALGAYLCQLLFAWFFGSVGYLVSTLIYILI